MSGWGFVSGLRVPKFFSANRFARIGTIQIANRRAIEAPKSSLYQGPLNGGVSNGGVSRSGLVLPFLSFFVLLGLSRGFSRFVRGLSGDFPDWSFSSFSAYYQHLRGTVPKGSATQSGPFPKKVGNPPVWKPPGLASLNKRWTQMPLMHLMATFSSLRCHFVVDVELSPRTPCAGGWHQGRCRQHRGAAPGLRARFISGRGPE